MTTDMNDDDIDALVSALHASGWDRPTTTTVLAAEDRAAAEALFGTTNAQRMASAPLGTRVRMVRTSEVYSVRNSRGWLVGAIEGRRNRPLYDGLSDAERTRVLRFARDRGFKVVEYANPTLPRVVENVPVDRYWWLKETEPPKAPSRPPSTPSGQVKRSRKADILRQLAGFRA